jgi:hypothetical protein
MTDVLIQLIEDVGLIGPELTELILEQFDKFGKVNLGTLCIIQRTYIFLKKNRIPRTQLI